MVQRNTPGMIFLVFHQLFLLGFFYAMRSCENLKVSGERRTHPLRKRNLVFIKNHRILPHESPLLETADALAVTFEYQKRDERDETVTQQRTDHHLLCPVKIGAKIIRRMQAQGATDDTFLYEYKRDSDGARGHLTGSQALTMLRDFIRTIDYESLGLDILTISAYIPYGRRQPWRCILTAFQFTLLCYWDAGPATRSSATSENKWRSSAMTSRAG